MKIKPNSLRFQLLFRSLIFIAVLLLLIGFFQYILMREFLYKNQALSIQNQIMTIHPDTWDSLINNEVPKSPSRSPFFSLMDYTVAFIDREGNFMALPYLNNRDEMQPPKLSDQTYQDIIWSKSGLNYKVVNENGGEQLVVLQQIEKRGYPSGLIQVSVSTKNLKEMLISQLSVFIILSVLALIGGLLAFKSVLRKTLNPLSNIVETVERIDSGNLNERFPSNQGQMEIDVLSISFNRMLERIETSFEAEKEAKEQMRRFVADASHELRTPLTSINGFLEVLIRGAINQPDQLRKSIKSMYSESKRMTKLVQDLLLLAKLDQSPNIQLTEGEMDVTIKEMEQQLKLLANNRKIYLNLPDKIKIFYDEDKIKQVILNLFHNAVQHTDPENGLIEISLIKVSDGIELSVKDNGIGISEEHLSHLFDRFYRSDSSRTRKYGGAGLGLSITKLIVEAHKGKIWVESTIGKESIFYVWLPAST